MDFKLVRKLSYSSFPRPDLGFDPEETFNENYAEACDLLQQILSVPPMGEKFTAAVSGLHSLANILDRLFQAWADEGEKLGNGIFLFCLSFFFQINRSMLSMLCGRCVHLDAKLQMYVYSLAHALNTSTIIYDQYL